MPDLNATVQNITAQVTPIIIRSEPLPTPAVPPGTVTTIFDWQPIPVFGIPIWFIISLVIFGLLVVTILHWRGKSADLNAIKPWFISAKAVAVGKLQTIRISRAGNFIPECLDIRDNVLSYGDSEENINMWHLNSSEGVIRIGGIPAAVISEDYDQNRDFVTEIAICQGSENIEKDAEDLRIKLNERHKQLIERGDYPENAENPANLILPIRSFDDYNHYGRRVLKLLYMDGIKIPPFIVFDQNKFRRFWPRGDTSMFFGGENIRKVEESFSKPLGEPNFFLKYGLFMFAILYVFAVLIFLYYYTP